MVAAARTMFEPGVTMLVLLNASEEILVVVYLEQIQQEGKDQEQEMAMMKVE